MSEPIAPLQPLAGAAAPRATPVYSLLAWDSDLFGFGVALLPSTSDPEALQSAVDAARSAGIRLAYLLVPHEEKGATHVADRAGGALVAKRVTFARPIPREGEVAPPDPRLARITVAPWTQAEATPELISLARQAGHYSRFRLDPKIDPGLFERLYALWIQRSVSGDIAKQVMVVRSANSISGLVTVGERTGRGEIGLLAVRPEARGSGIGKALVRAALLWAQDGGYREAQVVTQRANMAACRLYESSGYAVERLDNVYHLWL